MARGRAVHIASVAIGAADLVATSLSTRCSLPRCDSARLLALLLAACSPGAFADTGWADLSLEQLLNVEIVSAAKFNQKASEVASAVTVITRREIQEHGWRTIADVLRSVPGYFTHYDRAYDYIGARGFARPQDYNSRVLLLVDGQRTNDPIYDTAYVGSEQLIDLALVERIEVVRGPGSSVYGGNAVFGVINLITRKPDDIDGTELDIGAGSHRARYGRLTYGQRLASGAGVVASVSGTSSAGANLYFPEFDAPATNHGRTAGTDYDRNNQRFFARLSYEGLRLTAAGSTRDKGMPTGAYGARFDDRERKTSDRQSYVEALYQRAIGSGGEASGRLFWGSYRYHSPGHFGDPPVLNHDRAAANWWGGEGRLLSAWSARNTLVAGLEYQNNYRQQQWNYDSDPYTAYFADHHRSQRAGLFAQNDFQWTDAVKVSLGARYDQVSDASGEFTPRLGLVYRSSPQTVWKLQYGSAFRPPNAFERFYFFPDSQIANPSGLRPEKIVTYEAGVEHYAGRATRLAATAYHYRIRNLIEQAEKTQRASEPVTDPASGEQTYPETTVLQFVNVGPISARGLELEGEHHWQNGTRLRFSVDFQQARNDRGQQLSNSPRVVARMLGSAPLPWLGLRFGLEGQWMASRKTDAGSSVAPYGVVNLTLLRAATKDGWELSASVFNAFDRQYADPAALDTTVPGRDRFVQDGRTFWVRSVYYF